MVFSSLTFLCLFMPIVFLLHSVLPSIKAKNVLLIIASLLFYAYGEPIYVLLMIGSSLLNYGCARWAGHNPQKKNKAALVVAVVANLAVLVVFKYTGMLVSTWNSMTGFEIPIPVIALPIGISFFTFQALSYVIDVYRGIVDVQKNYFSVLLYISFFPQLIAGPIVKYRDINEQISTRSVTMDAVAKGLRRFICGLCKKVLIANTIATVADVMFSTNIGTLSMSAAWLGALAYLFQIYYDFSGYSDMAIGLGLMFGFHFKENFLYPYGARNMQDFWRRWHISLSTWFKEYLYIPLGGNRKGKGRTALNKIIVFFLTGLWHGANWTFVLWGLWHGLFLLLETYIPLLKKLPRVISHVYTLFVVTIGFVVFRADTILEGFSYIGRMFSFDFSSALALEQLTPWFIVMFVVACVGCAAVKPLGDRLRHAFEGATISKGYTAVSATLYVLAFVGLFWCILRLSSGAYNPFIYFRF
ncbi:MAG: MBOAT family protein [Clostridia bacterium]|nr:MBOAT family protein [Clostridia bacterium]